VTSGPATRESVKALVRPIEFFIRLPLDSCRAAATIRKSKLRTAHYDALHSTRSPSAHAAETRRLEVLRAAATGAAGPGELAWRHGADTARAALALRAALFAAPIPEGAEAGIAAGAGATFPVTAADLMPDWQGPALGARLKELERAWIASGFTADRATLLALPPRDGP